LRQTHGEKKQVLKKLDHAEKELENGNSRRKTGVH
jgi:hypothetical protein